VAGAEAGATATEPDALVDVRAHSVLIVPVRFALGIAGLVGARLLDVSPGASLGLFALGAGLFLVAILSGRRGRAFWQRAADAEPVDPAAPVEAWPRTLARAAYPSTIAVSALTAIAIPIDASLAAVTAGILGGMALGGAIFATELVLWEQSRGVRLLARPGGPRSHTLFVRPA
jgi:hypothetical protein